MTSVLDRDFIRRHTVGLQQYLDVVRSMSWADIEEPPTSKSIVIRLERRAA